MFLSITGIIHSSKLILGKEFKREIKNARAIRFSFGLHVGKLAYELLFPIVNNIRHSIVVDRAVI